jgi:hypothetical protein
MRQREARGQRTGGAGGRTTLRLGGHDAVTSLLEGLHDVNGDRCHRHHFPVFLAFPDFAVLAFLAGVFFALFAGADFAGAAGFAAFTGSAAAAGFVAAIGGAAAAGFTGCAASFSRATLRANRASRSART